MRFDVGGEKIFLVDDTGYIVPGTTALAAFAILALRSHGGGIIAVPANQPCLFEEIAARYGGSVLRTKSDPSALMAAATKNDVILAGDGTGNYIIPNFQPAIDGIMAFAKLLEHLAAEHAKFSDVIAEVPMYYTANRSVPCPWDSKGKVMRLLNEKYKSMRGKQIDGMKIEMGKEWVLVVPDPDRPICRVYVEADSHEHAQVLVEEYAHEVEELEKA